MIVNFFSKTKSINFIIMGLSLVLIFVYSVFLKEKLADYESLNSFLIFLNLLIISILFFVFKYTITENNLTNNTDYGILFFLVIFSLITRVFELDISILLVVFLLFSFNKMLSLGNKGFEKRKIFDSAFGIGLATIFSPISIVFLVLLYFTIGVFKKITWRHFLIPIIGFFTPILVFYTYLLYINSGTSIKNLLTFSIDIGFNFFEKVQFQIISISLFIWVGIIHIIRKITSFSILFKRKIGLTIILFFLILFVLILTKDKAVFFLFLIIPSSIILGNYIYLIKRKWIKEIVVYFFIFLSIFTLVS